MFFKYSIGNYITIVEDLIANLLVLRKPSLNPVEDKYSNVQFIIIRSYLHKHLVAQNFGKGQQSHNFVL